MTDSRSNEELALLTRVSNGRILKRTLVTWSEATGPHEVLRVCIGHALQARAHRKAYAYGAASRSYQQELPCFTMTTAPASPRACLRMRRVWRRAGNVFWEHGLN